MYLRHQTYTLYYRDVCILVFLLAYFMLLRCMLKFKRLACGSYDVTQYNTIYNLVEKLRLRKNGKYCKHCLHYTNFSNRLFC